jgi:drug/metabolite transporter (DMT)-like permease
LLLAAAALILLAIARLQKLRIRPTRAELLTLIVAGNLLWCGGNGLVLWAEQYASSGFAALMVSSAPIWTVIIELFMYRKRPSAVLIISLFIGFSGVAILSMPSLVTGSSTNFSATVALVLSPLCWVLGSVLQARRPVRLAPQTMSGYHQLAAFFGFLIVSLALGEPVPHPSAQAWLAWGYLVIFASVGAFTSYICALRMLPMNIVMTYAYVNPVLALILGWLLLNEPITLRTLCGAGLVLLSVFVIFRVKQSARPEQKQNIEAAEPAAVEKA